MIDKVVEAVCRGVNVELCMDGRYLIGDQMSTTGAQLLIGALDDIARSARGRGRLRIFQVDGRRAQAAYGRYGRKVSERTIGSLHAKVMYTYPYLVVGSTNWSVSSEANKELSILIQVEDDETRDYFEDELSELQHGKLERNRYDLARALETGGQAHSHGTGSSTTRSRRGVTG